jgi:hypothetical protein
LFFQKQAFCDGTQIFEVCLACTLEKTGSPDIFWKVTICPSLLESHRLSITKNLEAEVAPLPLLVFVTLQSHLLVMLLKQKRNNH